MADYRQLSPQLLKDSSRIDVDSLMNDFKKELGADRWENYRDSLTHFLMGKLSRPELVRCLKEQIGLSGSGMRNHNTLLLSLLANACREAPPGAESSLADWKANTRNKGRYSGIDANNDNLHREILMLPVRERRRIKNIANEAPNYLRNPLFPLPTEDHARFSMLPRIPLPNSNQSSTSQSNSNQSNSSGQASTQPQDITPTQAVPPKENVLMDPLLNLHPGKSSGPLTWTQDIIQGLDMPLMGEMNEVVDDSSLGTRMLSVALENGVLGGIGPGTTDIMLLGLESYFRNIIDQLFELKHRKITTEQPLGIEDFSLLADLRPSDLGDRNAPILKLRGFMLEDEESVGVETSKRTNPWDLEGMRKKIKVTEEGQKAMEEHERGVDLVNELLSEKANANEDTSG